jgi:hypothetical protein
MRDEVADVLKITMVNGKRFHSVKRPLADFEVRDMIVITDQYGDEVLLNVKHIVSVEVTR